MTTTARILLYGRPGAATLPDEVEELVWMTRDDETRMETAS